MLFATAHLPPKTPNFWGTVVEFANMGRTSRSAVIPEQARVLMDNLKSLDEQAYSTDQQLLLELIHMSISPKNKPLGLILLSQREVYALCNSKLLDRSDKA